MQKELTYITLFDELGDIEILNMISYSERCMFKAGEYLFKKGDKSDEFHMIYSGEVELTIEDKDNEIKLLNIGSCNIVGEIGFIDGNPRTATVRALSDTETLSISNAVFDQIQTRFPLLASKILRGLAKTLAERLRWCDNKIASNSVVKIPDKFFESI